jgi:hypothetical protein
LRNCQIKQPFAVTHAKFNLAVRSGKTIPRCISTVELVYEVGPRTDHRGVDLISDALPFGRL